MSLLKRMRRIPKAGPGLALAAAGACLFQGCASLEPSPEDLALRQRARSIPVANAITVTELQRYQELGPLDCDENTAFHSASESAEACRDSLKLEAAKLGGDLVIVESQDATGCWQKDNCLHMHGRAYRKVEKPPTNAN